MLILSSAYQIFEEDLLDKEEQYRQSYHSFGLSGMILSWLKRGMKEPPVQMAEILVHTTYYDAFYKWADSVKFFE